MSKLEELIQEYCPDGVEYVPLWSVTIWDKKFNAVESNKQPIVDNYKYLLANELFSMEVEGGNVFLLSTGEQTGWTTEAVAGDYLKDGEVVSIPWGKSRAVTDCIKYHKGKFVTADNRIATSNDTERLSNKYLYYWLMSQGKVLDSFYRGSGIKHPDMSKVLDLEVPLPALPVQREIVRVLDEFTLLSAELAAELAARKKQYEYYRNELLTFKTEVDRVQLSKVASINRGKRLVREELSPDEGYPVYQNSLTPLGYYNESNCNSEKTFVISAGAAGEVGYSRKPFWAADDCLYFDCSEKITERYLYHFLMNNHAYLKRQVRKSSVPRLSRNVIENIVISIPSIAVQNKITEVLDNFDAICSDLNIGLPAEIEARQKQYEYYRDKLLNFRRKD